MRTIAIVNQKGGCGKTTTAINLAAHYARRGLRTLVVDMDSQGHCAAGLGVPENCIEYSIGDALLADHTASFNADSLIWEVSSNLYLAPSTVMLAALESPGGGLHQLPDKDRRLENLLKIIGNRFDRCLIDCPPSIGLLTFNALRASRETLIPVETGFFSLQGAQKQWTTIQRTIAHIGRPIACHMLPTLHDQQSRLSRNILTSLRRDFAGQILPTVINVHEVLREAASFGQPVLEYAPSSKACEDFTSLADWLEEHNSQPAVEIEFFDHESGTAAVGATPRPVLQTAGPTMSESTHHVPPPSGGRAAELVRRVHELSTRPSNTSHGTNALSVSPRTFGDGVVTSSLAKDIAGKPSWTHDRSSHAQAHGVKRTDRGVLFSQPGPESRSVFLAGDFNRWSATANPLRYNDALHVFETVLNLPPGTYQYRLIVDGNWLPDPYNDRRQVNRYGEMNSVVTVD